MEPEKELSADYVLLALLGFDVIFPQCSYVDPTKPAKELPFGLLV